MAFTAKRQRALQPGGRVRQIGALAVGVAVGLLLGYIVMETADSMMNSGQPLLGTGGMAGAVDAVRHNQQRQQQQQQQQGGTAAGGVTAAALQQRHQQHQQQQQATAGQQQDSGTVSSSSTNRRTGEGAMGGGASTSTSGAAGTGGAPRGAAAGGAAVEALGGGQAYQAPGDRIHSVMTSSGSGYQNFQGRIMYGTYKLVQKMPGGDRLAGFTRILHRVHPDECMDEIPTFHAQPLHPACDQWCDFPVADRPNAVAQWIAAVQKEPTLLKGAWVALLECDYVWMKPLPTPGDAYSSTALGWQYHFGYIIAQHPDCAYIIRRLYDGRDPAEVPNSGPAPALLRFRDLVTTTPLWEQVTAAIELDKEAVKVLGWVREMYAWDIALAKAKVQMVTEDAPRSPLMAQPPSDHEAGNASIFHYTWGATYSAKNSTAWHWDKRDYTQPDAGVKPQPLPMPPPLEEWAQDKWHLQDGLPVSKQLHGTMRDMIGQMNKAIMSLPDLTDKYRAVQEAAAAAAAAAKRAAQ